MVFRSGPFNIEQGNSVSFGVEFLDVLGSPTVPASATMAVAYITNANQTQVDTVSLTPVGSYFTGVWSSTSATLGLATWVAATSFSSIQVATGQIRVLQRRAG